MFRTKRSLAELAEVGTLPDCLLRVQVGAPIGATEAGSAVDTGDDVSVLRSLIQQRVAGAVRQGFDSPFRSQCLFGSVFAVEAALRYLA